MANVSDLRSLLNGEEIATLQRFVKALSNPGIKAKLIIEAVYVDDPRAVAVDAIKLAIEELHAICQPEGGDVVSAENVFRAAPSLEIVVGYARDTKFFPKDFLPSDATVKTCLNAFFYELRKDSYRAF